MFKQPIHQQPTARTVLAIFVLAAAALVGTGDSAAGVVNVNPSMTTAQINQAIADAAAGDTINFTTGTYQKGLNESYTFVGDRNYEFEDGTTLRGFTTEVGIIFKTTGSNITITGHGTVVLENTVKGGLFGAYGSAPYTNISVQGLVVKPEAIAFEWANIRHSSERTGPDISFSHITVIGGTTGFHFSNLSQQPDSTSPYVSLDHITGDGVGALLIDLFVIDDNGNWVTVGDEDITNVALLNSSALVSPALWTYFNSPSDVAQMNVTEPYENTSTNCFVTTDMKLLSGTYVPALDSPLNLGGGKYIGAYAPAPEPGMLGLLVLGGVAMLARRRCE